MFVNGTLDLFFDETPDPEKSEFTFIDLFAGIGGMRLAFEQTGDRCLFSSEIDTYCQKVYEKNFGVRPVGDITQIDPTSIPDHDILVGGFPCQPFSIAGISKKNSLGQATGFEDKTHGTLFFNICQILEEKRPKAFLLENVKNLTSHDKKRTFRIIREVLEELDYKVFYKIVDGAHYVPQHRERIFIVGFDRRRFGSDIDFQFNLTPPETKPVLSSILEPEVEEKYTLSDNLWNYLQDYAQKQREKGNGFGYSLADINGTTRTLSARYYKDGSEILIPQKDRNPRKLTPEECKRLQGFPDWFQPDEIDFRAYKQFGNSVVVPLVNNIAGLINAKLLELDAMGKMRGTL